MKNAIKVLCFVLAVILIIVGAAYFMFFWQKSDFEIMDGVNNGTAVITAYKGDSVNIKIPNRIRGKKVVAIDDNAFEDSKIVSVELNKYITSVGKDAFYNCQSLKEADLKNVKSIGETAFGNCASLTKIEIPATVERFNNVPFLNDEKLTEVVFEENGHFINENNVIYSADKSELVQVLPCAKLKEFTCPQELRKIYAYAFYNQTSLESFKYNNNIKAIGNATFLNCSKLSNLIIPDSVVEIDSIIINQTAIKSIVIPATVSKIDDNAFTKLEDSLTIKTTSGSVAERFAKEKGFKLEIIK